ncbi:MAG: antitoxin family protein [Candidatus Scalinduaceae bacterium]
MGRTIKVRFSKGVIKPLEKVDVAEGKEIAVTIKNLGEKEKVRKALKIPLHLVKAETLLKYTGLISIGGDAVKESKNYDK